MQTDLSGKVALVVGGTGGIGHAVVEELSDAGATVVSVDITDTGAPAGPRLEHLVADMGEPDDVDRVVRGIAERHGRLDILVHAIGIYPRESVVTMDVDTWDLVQRVNVRSLFLSVRGAAELMSQDGGGQIVALTSGIGVAGRSGAAAYGSSKKAVVGFVRCAAVDLLPLGITINCIGPGITATGMSVASARDEDPPNTGPDAVPIRQPSEVAQTMLYFFGPVGSTVTGTSMWMRNPE